MDIEPVLHAGAVIAVVLWSSLAAYVIHIDRRRTAARRIVADVLATLARPEVQSAALDERVSRVTPLLEQVSRDMVLHTAADGGTPDDAVEVLTTYLVERWGIYTILREASFHRRSRDIWRRTASLKVLFHLDHPQILELLARALEVSNPEIASVALTLLGRSTRPRAAEILIDALRSKKHPPSRVAVHLERSPVRPAEGYRGLLDDPDPLTRFWGATLLADFPEVDWVERALAPLVRDPDPRVRKAAIQSLGMVGDGLAADVALQLLEDPSPFVRGHAARALGELGRTESAPDVAKLLADPEWWVRSAAKAALETMGAEVWPVLMRCLDDPDEFVRNGAAEVFQNLGILDDLIVMEAATDDPSHSKLELLRRIAAAGGTRLTDSLIERSGAAAPRVRQLLSSIGLEQVGVA